VEAVARMAKCEKIHDSAKGNPAGLRFAEARRLAECFGFTLARSEGSHFIYTHEKLTRPLPLQKDRNGMAKGYQVKQLLAAIEQVSESDDD
jgi:hypothetical protein